MRVDANRISCAACVCASSKPCGNSTHKVEGQMSLSQLDCTHLQILDLREKEGKEQVNGGEVHVILFLSKTLVT